jgi:hypothetical protein
LALAPEWVARYRGKQTNIIKRYRKTFHVDWECAIHELQELGVEHDAEYLSLLQKTIDTQFQDEKKKAPISRWEFDEYLGIEPLSDEYFAYIVGYTSGGFPYGLTWEQWEALEEAEREENSKAEG